MRNKRSCLVMAVAIWVCALSSTRAEDPCTGADCTTNCDTSACCDLSACCCEPCHCISVFGEYLLLYPTGIDLVDAARQNGVGAGAVPNGAAGVLNPESNGGFRAGVGFSLTPMSSLYGAYTFLETDDANTTTPTPGGGANTVRSLVLFPSTAAAALGTAQLDSVYDVNFQLADVAFKTRLAGTSRDYLNMHVGGRYGHLDQDFSQTGTYGVVGTVNVDTEIDFDGGGVLLGLDTRVGIGRHGFGLYGDLFFSSLFGEFTSDYTQTNITAAAIEAQSSFTDNRVLPILQGQLGVDWVSANGGCMFRVGHMSSYWFNAVTTGEFIEGVQGTNFLDVNDSIAFQGLAAMVEFRR